MLEVEHMQLKSYCKQSSDIGVKGTLFDIIFDKIHWIDYIIVELQD